MQAAADSNAVSTNGAIKDSTMIDTDTHATDPVPAATNGEDLTLALVTQTASTSEMIAWEPRDIEEMAKLLSFTDILLYINSHFEDLTIKSAQALLNGDQDAENHSQNAAISSLEELFTSPLAENSSYGIYIRIIREVLGHIAQCKNEIELAEDGSKTEQITQAKHKLLRQLQIHREKLPQSGWLMNTASAINQTFWSLAGYNPENPMYDIASQLLQQLQSLLDEQTDLQALTLKAFDRSEYLNPEQSSLTQPLVVGVLGRIQYHQQLLAEQVISLQDELSLGKQSIVQLQKQMEQTHELGQQLDDERREQQLDVAKNVSAIAELEAKQEQEMRGLIEKLEQEKARDETISSELSKFLSKSQIEFFRILYQALLENTNKDEEPIITEVLKWFIEHAVEVTSEETLTHLHGESEAITDIKRKIQTCANPQERAELAANKQSFQDYIKECSLPFSHQTFAIAIFYSLACDGTVAPGDEAEKPGLLFPEHLALRKAIYQAYQSAQTPNDAASAAANSPYRTPKTADNSAQKLRTSNAQPRKLFNTNTTSETSSNTGKGSTSSDLSDSQPLSPSFG